MGPVDTGIAIFYEGTASLDLSSEQGSFPLSKGIGDVSWLWAGARYKERRSRLGRLWPPDQMYHLLLPNAGNVGLVQNGT